MVPTKLPSARVLRQLFDYNPDTGELTRKPAPRSVFATHLGWVRHNQFSQQAAKPQPSQRYMRVYVLGINTKVHRVIWKMMTGREPPALLDHANRNGNDNRWENLRRCTGSQSQANRTSLGRYRRGVFFADGVWAAAIGVRGRKIYLGTFPTEEAAHAAYCEAGRKHFGPFFHPG